MASKERLTEKHYNGKGYYMLCSGVLRCDGKCGDCDELDKLVDRLGEFEDKAEKTVEVVRCEKCKHYKQYTSYKSDQYCNWGKCLLINMDVDMPTTGYCCFGDRKEDG